MLAPTSLYSLVFKMPHSSEYHSNTMAVTSVYRLLIPNRATGLYYCCNACFSCCLYTIIKGKECIGCKNGPFNLLSTSFNSLLHRPYAVNLPWSNTQGLTILSYGYTIGFCMLHNLPGKLQILKFFLSRLSIGNYLPRLIILKELSIYFLNQKTSGYLFHIPC